MKIIAVDDEFDALSCIEKTICEAIPGCALKAFTNPKDALEYAKLYEVAVAFLDIEMKGITGLELGLELKRYNPQTNIIFITGYADYTGKALKLRASGYIMKPASVKDIQDEIENLRYKPEMGKMYVRCFGSFEVFYEGKPLFFQRAKSKEIFAYLIDRKGGAVNTSEIIGVLWEDAPTSMSVSSQVRVFIAELYKTLKEAGALDWVVKRRNSFAIAPDKIKCDYYDFLNGNVVALNTYQDEYMLQYSWAEMTNGWLNQEKIRLR